MILNILSLFASLTKKPKHTYSTLSQKPLRDPLEYSRLEIPPKKTDLYLEARLKITRKTDLTLEERIQNFMKEMIFSVKDVDYNSIEETIDYFNFLSKQTDGKTKQTIETARTILHHLQDYLSEERKESFKKYLFGEEGVLTQRRLKDMRSVAKALTKPEKYGLEEFKQNTTYLFEKSKIKGERFNLIKASYHKYEKNPKRYLIRLNDEKSKGMYTDKGKIYWESLNEMLTTVEGKRIDARKTITHYINTYLEKQAKQGKIENIEGYFLIKNP